MKQKVFKHCSDLIITFHQFSHSDFSWFHDRRLHSAALITTQILRILAIFRSILFSFGREKTRTSLSSKLSRFVVMAGETIRMKLPRLDLRLIVENKLQGHSWDAKPIGADREALLLSCLHRMIILLLGRLLQSDWKDFTHYLPSY
jgi:hypothetical protein